MSTLFEDFRIPLNEATTLHRYRKLNAQSIVSLSPKFQALNISLADMLVIKKEINEELEKTKKSSKVGVSKVSKAPKTQAKRKFIIHESESEKIDSPLPVKKARTTNKKPVSSPSKLVTLPK